MQEILSLWPLLSRRYSLISSAAKLRLAGRARGALGAQRERPAAELNWRRVRWKESLGDVIPFMQEGFSMVGSRSLRLLASDYDPVGFRDKIDVYPKSEGYELQSVLHAQSATQALAKGTLKTVEEAELQFAGDLNTYHIPTRLGQAFRVDGAFPEKVKRGGSYGSED